MGCYTLRKFWLRNGMKGYAREMTSILDLRLNTHELFILLVFYIISILLVHFICNISLEKKKCNYEGMEDLINHILHVTQILYSHSDASKPVKKLY